MLKLICLYLFSGIISVSAAVIIHLAKAEGDGYDALNWWSEHKFDAIHEHRTTNTLLLVLWGIIIWPVRIIQFIRGIKKYYAKYELK